ncbi:MAG: hypothetical protein JW889_11230 [Verrucomicrobia bacterium]|nr:hypothetical protein [Verrucomicrobiota bacterium]
MCHKVLQDARLYLLLLRFDEDLARETRRRRCRRCGGRLDQGHFPRKPRVPSWVVLPDGYDVRFSYSCAVDGCRKRHTPPSTRFLGRRIYLGAVVVLATTMQQGTTPWRVGQLRELLGVSSQTLARWRAWWAQAFAESTFWKAARAAFSPPVAEAAAPHSLLVRFAGDALDQLAALLRFLMPLSMSGAHVPDRRR